MTDFSMTSYLSKKLGDHVLDGMIYTPPAQSFLSLHTGNPTRGGVRTFEISTSGTGYARQILTGNLSSTDAVTGLQSLIAVMNYSPALIDIGTITYVGIDDAATSGNMLLFAAISTAQVANAGYQFQLVPGQLSVLWQ
jgi:hypothetical protein